MFKNLIYFVQQKILIMGNQKSEQKKEFEIEINHPRLTKSKIIATAEDKKLQTNFSVDEKEFDKWKLATAKYTTHPPNLLLPLSSSFSRTGMCGHTGTATINYQNYSYLLTEEIYNRKGKKTRFTEVQIWFLLYSLSRAREQALFVGEKLGDVRPRNVFLNEEGKIKVTNSLSWPSQVSNIQKTMDKVTTYLAPEDLSRVGKNELFDGPNEVSEAFSIGLTVLSGANLTDYQSLYDLKNFDFNLKTFNQEVLAWRTNNNFSEVLRGTVLALLQLDVSKRFTTNQLAELLNKHGENIEKKVNFVIDNAPLKLHEQIMSNRKFLSQLQQPYIPPPVLSQSSKVLGRQSPSRVQ